MKRQNIGKQAGRLLLALVVLVFFAGTSYPQGDDEGKSYVRISFIEKGVTLQRATEVAPETPIINILLMAGDRLWTDESGRVECQFENGTILRMNANTKVDFQSIFDTAASYKSSTILRMWSGSIYLKTVNLETPDENFQVDTPACSVYLISDGTFRIDLDEENNTRLSVYNGVAETVSEGESVLVKSGQRCYISPNEYPSEPESFNTASFDDFDEWNYQREETLSVAVSQQYISPEATYYASELESYGAWHYYARYQSYVWRPYYVDNYWIPYTYGRWNWYPCGWTWISSYSWGWIPFHYGWWDLTPLWGWVWVPGTYWSPAWVYWAAGPHYIGWAPYTYGYWRSGIYASMYKYNYGRYNRFDSKHWTFIPRNAIANPDIRKVKFSAEQINKLNAADAQFYNPQSGRSVGELQRRAMAKSGYNLPSNVESKALPKDINRAPPETERKVKEATTRSTTQEGKVLKLKTPSTSGKDTSVTEKGKVTSTPQQKTKTPAASKGKVTPTKQQKTKTPPKKSKPKPKTPPPTASSRSTSQTWKGLSSSSSTSSASKEKRATTSYSQQPKSTSSSYRSSKSSVPRKTPSLKSQWSSSSKSVTSRSAKSSSYSPSTSSSLKSRTPSLGNRWSSSKSVTSRSARSPSSSYSKSPSSTSRSRTTSFKSSWPSSSKSVTSRTAKSISSAWRSPSSGSRYRTYSSTPSRYYSPSQPRYRAPSYSQSLKNSYRPSYSSPSISRGSSSFRSFSGSSSVRSGAVRSSTPSRSYSPSRSSSVRSGSKAVKKR